MNWFLDWWWGRAAPVAQPAAEQPKSEQQLVYELVVQLLSTPSVEFKRYDKECESWSHATNSFTHVHWLTNDDAQVSVQVEVDRLGIVKGTQVWVGGQDLELGARQALDLMRLLNHRLEHAAAVAKQARTHEQLRLLVEAAERLL